MLPMNNKILPSNNKFIFEPHIALENKLPCIYHVDLMHRVGAGNVHENIELIYVVSGKGHVLCDDILYEVKKGDVIAIDSYMMHQVRPDEEIQILCLIINRDFCKANNINTSKLHFVQKIQNDFLNQLFDTLMEEYSAEHEFKQAGIKCALLNIVLFLCRNFAKEKPSAKPISESAFHYVRKSTDYIKENLTKKLTVDEIASNVGLSKYYFLRQFKKITGYTVIDYVNIIRCEYAQELLRSEKYKIKEVALLCGFDNFSYFTNVYKKYTGTLPSDMNQFPKR